MLETELAFISHWSADLLAGRIIQRDRADNPDGVRAHEQKKIGSELGLQRRIPSRVPLRFQPQLRNRTPCLGHGTVGIANFHTVLVNQYSPDNIKMTAHLPSTRREQLRH
jgi:hypothetical protein